MKEERIYQKVDAYVTILETIASMSESSTLQVGCIALHKNFKGIPSYGYNGRHKGCPTCDETGTKEKSLVPGKSGFIHAEVNMLAKFREDIPGDYIIILTDSPCEQCMEILINADFENIYWVTEYRVNEHLQTLTNLGINCGDVDQLKLDYKKGVIHQKREWINGKYETI